MIESTIVSLTITLLYIFLLGNLFYRGGGGRVKKIISGNRFSEKTTKYLFYITIILIIPLTTPYFKGFMESFLADRSPIILDLSFFGTLFILLRVIRNTVSSPIEDASNTQDAIE